MGSIGDVFGGFGGGGGDGGGSAAGSLPVGGLLGGAGAQGGTTNVGLAGIGVGNVGANVTAVDESSGGGGGDGGTTSEGGAVVGVGSIPIDITLFDFGSHDVRTTETVGASVDSAGLITALNTLLGDNVNQLAGHYLGPLALSLQSLVTDFAAGNATLDQLRSGLTDGVGKLVTQLGALDDDVRMSLLPSISTAGDALAKIFEAIVKGENLPADSVLAIFREVLMTVRRVGGKEGAQIIGPLAQILAVTLPRVLGKREQLVDELLVEGDELTGITAEGFVSGLGLGPAAVAVAGRVAVWVLQTFGAAFILALIPQILDSWPELKKKVLDLGTSSADFMMHGVEQLHRPMQAVVDVGGSVLFRVLDEELEAIGEVKPEDVPRVAPRLLSVAAGLGMSAHIVATVAEKVHLLKELGFPQLAAFLVDMAGFKPIADSVWNERINAALRLPTQRAALKQFRSALPDPRAFDLLFVKRLVSDESFTSFYAEHGWTNEMIDAYRQGVFRAPTARDLAFVFQDADVEEADLQRMLERAGFRDEDVAALVPAIKIRSGQGARMAVLSSVLDGFEKGVYNDQTLDLALAGLNLREETLMRYKAAAQNRRYVKQISDRLGTLRRMAGFGGITNDGLAIELRALGLDEQGVAHELTMARLEHQKEIATQEAADVHSELMRARSNSISVAMEQFRRFDLDEAGLAAALSATGIIEDEIAPLMELAKVRRTPVPKLEEVLSPNALLQRVERARQDQVLELVHKGLLNEAAASALLMLLGLTENESRAKASLVATRAVRPVVDTTAQETAAAERQERAARESAAVDEFQSGALTSETLRSRLEQIGFTKAVAAAKVEKALALKTAADARTRARESKSLLNQEIRTREQQARALFRRGDIDADQLFTILVQLGQTEENAAAIVGLEAARRKRGKDQAGAPAGGSSSAQP